MRVDLLWPAAWWAGLVVAAVGAMALRRPARRTLIVASVSGWQPSAAAGGRAASRWRPAAAWACLLGGAMAAVGALSGPILIWGPPVRTITLAIVPAAPLAPSWRGPILSVLDRLEPDDRVRLVLPVVLGGAGEFGSPVAARKQVEAIEPIAVDVRRLSLPPLAGNGPVFLFGPSGDSPAAPNVRKLALPVARGAMLERLGGDVLPGGSAQFLVAVRNTADGPRAGRVRLTVYDSSGAQATPMADIQLSLEAGRRRVLIVDQPNAPPGVEAVLEDSTGAVLGRAGLVLSPGRPVRVAMTGDDEPALRRLIDADASLQLAARAPDADVVVCIGQMPPPDRPALVLAPPQPPPGWAWAQEQARLDLSSAVLAGPTELTRGVDLSGVTVRRVRAWTGQTAGGKPLLRAGDQVLAVVCASPVRQVWLAFGLSQPASDLAGHEAMVVWMLNVLDWLAGRPASPGGYQAIDPLAAAGMDLSAVDVAHPPSGVEPSPGKDGLHPARSRGGWATVPSPGLYRDRGGSLVAVAAGPVAARVDAPATGPEATSRTGDAHPAGAQLELPPPQWASPPRPMWPYLALAAVVLWLAGWLLKP